MTSAQPKVVKSLLPTGTRKKDFYREHLKTKQKKTKLFCLAISASTVFFGGIADNHFWWAVLNLLLFFWHTSALTRIDYAFAEIDSGLGLYLPPNIGFIGHQSIRTSQFNGLFVCLLLHIIFVCKLFSLITK